MTEKENKEIAQLLINIGKAIQNNPDFIKKLDTFIKKNSKPLPKEKINLEKINSTDLYKLSKEKTIGEIEAILADFSLKELKAISKKYRFGNPSKIRTVAKMQEHIINQLQKRQTDVFRDTSNDIKLEEKKDTFNKE